MATSGGGVDLNNVTAIELEVTGAADVNGAVELVGAVGSTQFSQSFANFESADLSLSKSIDDATPTVGQAVTFTFAVANSGPDAATGVVVTDVLPEGIEFNSFSTANGTYNATNGQWTPGTINNGQVATLTITGTVTSVGAKTNSAEITAAAELDPDSTPGNNVVSEDDQASVTLVPQTIDLSLTKSVDDAVPNVGDTVTFTITLRNDGVDTATNVAVRDLLPSGLALLTGVPTSGSYNTTSGVWSVPALASGGVETLTITATVNATGSLTNTAEVTAADQTDIDSTPNNNVPTEDDQASVSLLPARRRLIAEQAGRFGGAQRRRRSHFYNPCRQCGTGRGVGSDRQRPASSGFDARERGGQRRRLRPSHGHLVDRQRARGCGADAHDSGPGGRRRGGHQLGADHGIRSSRPR